MLTHSMVTAARSRDEHNHIWKATGGIIFLATPFRGTSFEDVADWVVSCLKITTKFNKKQLTKLLKSLKASTPLEKLVQDFTQICQQRREQPGDPPLELAIFCETKKTNLLKNVFLFSSVADAVRRPKLLVPLTSGCLDIVPNPLQQASAVSQPPNIHCQMISVRSSYTPLPATYQSNSYSQSLPTHSLPTPGLNKLSSHNSPHAHADAHPSLPSHPLPPESSECPPSPSNSHNPYLPSQCPRYSTQPFPPISSHPVLRRVIHDGFAT